MNDVSTKEKARMYEKTFSIIRHAVDAIGCLFRFLFEYAKDYREARARGADTRDGDRE